MKICLFGITGIALGKHNVKDPRLDQADKLVEAQKKTYAQMDVVEEKEMLTCDAILTTRTALSDLLMKDLDAVETRLGRDPGEYRSFNKPHDLLYAIGGYSLGNGNC
jgi:hypothetical protein